MDRKIQRKDELTWPAHMFDTCLSTSFPTDTCPRKNQARGPFWCPYSNVKKSCIRTQAHQHTKDTGHRPQKTEIRFANAITAEFQRLSVTRAPQRHFFIFGNKI